MTRIIGILLRVDDTLATAPLTAIMAGSAVFCVIGRGWPIVVASAGYVVLREWAASRRGES